MKLGSNNNAVNFAISAIPKKNPAIVAFFHEAFFKNL